MHQSSFEELVQRFENPDRANWQKPQELINWMQVKNHEVIADIGAGTGYLTLPLANKANKVIAIDIDQRFLDYIDEHNTQELNIETRLSEEDRPNLEMHEVDKALMVNVAHHLNKRAKYFSRVKKGLKVGGEFIVVEFKKGKLPVGPPDKYKSTQGEIRRDLAMAGF